MKFRILLLLAVLCVLCGIGRSGDTPQMKIPAVEERNPWTHLNVRNSAENFQFAILADRNGGGRHEVFREAIRKLNLLQPEIVLSVGDYIPGYTTNALELNRQWEEFRRDVAPLEAPLFLLPGNHDVTNAVEHKEWEKRLGRKFYHFVYGNVLFLCLNSQDPVDSISAEQVEYFRKALQENQDVRWTLVFLHQPLFLADDSDGESGNGWGAFEKLIQGRKHTVFAGHLHHYARYERKGMKYILLATTGGGSSLRGVRNFGEFDQIAWVTMTDAGPRVANIELDGVWDENARTGEVARIVDPALKRAIDSDTVFLEPAKGNRGSGQIRLKNDADVSMHLRLEFENEHGVEVTTKTFETVLEPHATTSTDVAVMMKAGTEPAEVGPVPFRWNIGFDDAIGDRRTSAPGVELSGTKILGVEPLLACRESSAAVEVDGKLDEWDSLPFAWRPEKHSLPDQAIWSGMSDSSFQFATRHDGEFVYVAVRVQDDRVVTNPDRDPWAQDCIEVRLDARPDPERSRGRGRNEGTDILVVSTNIGDSPGKPRLYMPEAIPAGFKVALARTADGYAAEIAVPSSYLDDKQGHCWNAFRLNVAVDDYDDRESSDYVFLSWRPDWRGADNYEGSGTFLRR